MQQDDLKIKEGDILEFSYINKQYIRPVELYFDDLYVTTNDALVSINLISIKRVLAKDKFYKESKKYDDR